MQNWWGRKGCDIATNLLHVRYILALFFPLVLTTCPSSRELLYSCTQTHLYAYSFFLVNYMLIAMKRETTVFLSNANAISFFTWCVLFFLLVNGMFFLFEDR